MVGKFSLWARISYWLASPFSFTERRERDVQSDLPDLVISVFLMAYDFIPDGKTKP